MLDILLSHAAALYLFWYAPRFWAAKDAAAFQANGSADSLHGVFHRQRFIWRAVSLVLLALSASTAVPLGHWAAFACSSAALMSLGGAYFFYDFNPRLSRARCLPEYYVSFDPNAAFFPDRWLAGKTKAWWMSKRPEGSLPCACGVCLASQELYASQLLERLTVQVLEAGALLYLALLAATYFLQ